MFKEQPGLWFVVATLLPSVSVLILLIGGGLRQILRQRRDNALAETFYNLLGGDRPGKSAAYVATAAIGLAFACSFLGAVQYPSSFKTLEAKEAELLAVKRKLGHVGAKEREEKKELVEKLEKLEAEVHDEEHKWQGCWTWARLGGKPAADKTDAAAKTDDAAAVELKVGFKIDHLSVVMFLMVTFIATLIHIFSMGYMSEELEQFVDDHHVHTDTGHLRRRGRFGRFFLYLSLFCFSMLNLILADNLFQVFVSWELVGICSFLLIGFYYERQSASNAANKAFITNRVGDAGMILGMLIIWTYMGTFNFQEIFQRVRAPIHDSHGTPLGNGAEVIRISEPDFKPNVFDQILGKSTIDPKGDHVLIRPSIPYHFHSHELDDGQEVSPIEKRPTMSQFGAMPYWLLVAAGIGIFIGCMGKSAQFPLHVWLPDAMEGPTPVSALIHAATMVAAGVYLVGRCFPLFVPESRLVIAYTGGITLFVAATIAIVMTDIKKVLAYSTVSQLGYMMLALGVGGWVAGLFHLVTHAFFKALLFLGSGSVIYGCHHEQEMTKMGGLFPKMKITALTMLVGVLAIAGTPLFSGWYSKDAIIAQALGFVRVNREHFLLLVLPLVTAGITTFYMFRMWFMTFTGKPRDHHVHEHAHESPSLMTVPLIILAFMSLTVAWGWPLHDAHASFLGHQIHHGQHHAVIADFGRSQHDPWDAGPVTTDELVLKERAYADKYAMLAEGMAFATALLGFLFALAVYYLNKLDPEEAKENFSGLHRFLAHKWYFDELYSVILVRPALVVAHWCKGFDGKVIDRFIDNLGHATIWTARKEGRFDNGIVDGLVNLVARVTYSAGERLRYVQTGFIRNYVLFLVLAAVGIFVALSYVVAIATAG